MKAPNPDLVPGKRVMVKCSTQTLGNIYTNILRMRHYHPSEAMASDDALQTSKRSFPYYISTHQPPIDFLKTRQLKISRKPGLSFSIYLGSSRRYL